MNLFDKDMKKWFILVAFGILLFLGVSNISYFLNAIFFVLSILEPFIIGACIAFVVNIPMNFFERRVFHNVKRGKRALSMILAFFCIIGVIFLVCFLVLPELANTLYSLGNSIPSYVNHLKDIVIESTSKIPVVKNAVQQQDINWTKISSQLISTVQDGANQLLNSTFSVIASAVQTVIKFFLGFIFAINILLKKEKLQSQAKKILYAYWKPKTVSKVLRIGSLTSKAFSGFLTGQCTEAVILGTIIFVVMSILGLPYAVLIAAAIAMLSLIPIIGAFTGCFLGALLIFLVKPILAGEFILMFLVIQQLEGNLIYPHVVGNSVGLPSMWVLVAVTAGGSLGGVVGMLISIPASSVLYILFRENVYKKLRTKSVDNEISK